MIKAQATISVANYADGSQGWKFHTQEIPMDLKLEATKLHGMFGTVTFTEDGEHEEAQKVIKKLGQNLSQSQRLRLTLKEYWEKHKQDEFEEFEDYYIAWTDAMIKRIQKETTDGKQRGS